MRLRISDSVLGQAGFSLIELAITVGMLCVLGVGFAHLDRSRFGSLHDLQRKQETTALREFARATLDCKKTLAANPPGCASGGRIDLLNKDGNVFVGATGYAQIGQYALTSSCTNHRIWVSYAPVAQASDTTAYKDLFNGIPLECAPVDAGGPGVVSPPGGGAPVCDPTTVSVPVGPSPPPDVMILCPMLAAVQLAPAIPVSNATDLNNVASNGHYVLANDINAGGAWTPKIAQNLILDGNGHTISGLSVSAPLPGINSLGLFSRLTCAKVSNLTLSGFSLSSLGDGIAYGGALAAEAGNVDLSSIKVTGLSLDLSMNTGISTAGGMIGYGSGPIKGVNLTSTGNVRVSITTGGIAMAGGIIGNSGDSSYFDKLVTNGMVSSSGGDLISFVGGSVGQMGDGTTFLEMTNHAAVRATETGGINHASGVIAEIPCGPGGTYLAKLKNDADVSALLGNGIGLSAGVIAQIEGSVGADQLENSGNILMSVATGISGIFSAGGVIDFAMTNLTGTNLKNSGNVTIDTDGSMTITNAGGVLAHGGGIVKLTNVTNSGDIQALSTASASLAGVLNECNCELALQNATNSGGVTSNSAAAGILGDNNGNAAIDTATNTGTIKGQTYSAGIIGYAKTVTQAKNVENRGTIRSKDVAAGIAAATANGTILQDSTNRGDIHSPNYPANIGEIVAIEGQLTTQINSQKFGSVGP